MDLYTCYDGFNHLENAARDRKQCPQF